jgi:hypothetical protein
VEVIVAIDYEMTRPRILKIIVGIAAFYNVNLATFWLYNSTELILKKCHLCVKFDFTEKREKEEKKRKQHKRFVHILVTTTNANIKQDDIMSVIQYNNFPAAAKVVTRAWAKY